MKMNVACGPNVFPFSGWVNYDKLTFSEYFNHLRYATIDDMPAHQAKLAMFVRAEWPRTGPVHQHNMLEPFSHHDDSVDLIYVGQAIEHLNRRTQAVPFLKECRRMLRKGGVLRMTTPDLVKIITSTHRQFTEDQPEWFKDALPQDQLCYLLFGASGPDCTQSNYEGHFHIYSEDTMRLLLQEAGFAHMTFTPAPHPEIRDEGMSHSLCVEATK